LRKHGASGDYIPELYPTNPLSGGLEKGFASRPASVGFPPLACNLLPRPQSFAAQYDVTPLSGCCMYCSKETHTI